MVVRHFQLCPAWVLFVCKECNGALSNFYYATRNIGDFSIAWSREIVLDLNSSNVAGKVYTMCERPRFDSIVTVGGVAREHPDVEHVSNLIDTLIELG